MTKAIPDAAGTWERNFSRASSPPAEQPMPTMGKLAAGDAEGCPLCWDWAFRVMRHSHNYLSFPNFNPISEGWLMRQFMLRNACPWRGRQNDFRFSGGSNQSVVAIHFEWLLSQVMTGIFRQHAIAYVMRMLRPSDNQERRCLFEVN